MLGKLTLPVARLIILPASCGSLTSCIDRSERKWEPPLAAILSVVCILSVMRQAARGELDAITCDWWSEQPCMQAAVIS
ncbi:hypothetical protein A0H81_10264 [Grifola frondosa]|uniref:Uncharacterized protein n=1 Tax=Grifola frondosa TaxID=5627 RepID=A0A1C7LYN6_GRIFR|nr:hypothetical protein A0H81_10264 [Grifola frondosa]